MKIPGINVITARDLLDLGFFETYELQGRSPEVLFEDLCKTKTKVTKDRLCGIRLAVYFAETPDPDPKKLSIQAWSH